MYININTKLCTSCNEELPISDFYKNKSNPDGYTFICKMCHNRSVKKYQQTQNYKDYKRKYAQTKKGKEALNKAYRKYNKTEKGREKYIKKKARRKRDLQWIKLIDNPFPKEIEIHWHHINDMFVVPLPKNIHLNNLGSNHRDLCEGHIDRIYGLNLNKILDL